MGHIIHAAKRRKGWKRKFESVQRGRIRPLQKKKKKKRHRAALSAVFIQIGGFCFRPCSRLDIHASESFSPG